MVLVTYVAEKCCGYKAKPDMSGILGFATDQLLQYKEHIVFFCNVFIKKVFSETNSFSNHNIELQGSIEDIMFYIDICGGLMFICFLGT